MPLWLFITIAVVLFLGAIALLYRGLWGDRANKGRLRCPKCQYDMSGTFEAGKLVCPECGKDAGDEKNLKTYYIEGIPIILALILLLPHLVGVLEYYQWQREQDAATAIENLGGGVIWESIAPDSLLEWIPQPLRRYCDRVILVNWTSAPISNPKPTPISDAALIHLEGLTHLQELYLGNTNVTDDGLVHLQGMIQLRYLYLYETRVTDAGMPHLQALTQLDQLYLGGTNATDDGLVYLKGLTQLRFLDLTKTQVTEIGVAELQKALPNCEIHY